MAVFVNNELFSQNSRGSFICNNAGLSKLDNGKIIKWQSQP